MSSIDNQQLYRAWIGKRDADRVPIVMMHEGLGSVSQWLGSGFPQTLHEASGRAVFLYDRRGYGRSVPRNEPWATDFQTTEALDWLPRVLDSEGIDAALFYGHSDGATISLEFAASNPGRALRVVAEAPHTVVEERTLQGIRDLRTRFSQDGRLRDELSRYHGAGADALFAGWSGMWLHPGFSGCDIRAALECLEVPVMVIQGGEDPYGSDTHMRTIAVLSRAPVAQVWLADTGHAPHRQCDAWLDRVIRFLSNEER